MCRDVDVGREPGRRNAAVGLAQLAHFDQAQNKRKALWRTYADALAGIDGATLIDVDVDRSVPHLCVVLVAARDRDHVFRALRRQGVGVGAHYPPNHLQPAFAAWRRDLPVPEAAGAELLTLPFHQHVTDAEARRVVSALDTALGQARAAR
ncbi:DegT/DnrJ/EryC1/StrS family aminotransferase [Streptomyces goshikiensis]|uniref:DegT/DnrJ/EryC1/StrS family aminotransferase n=1 Tax=Streptomyces goshikiensis TaxID=1942 RepID=UPI001E44F0AC|nr:DegT/DnrJ/EryC1/StrS family aminotransferase [Streptomyces goshikiensis]